MIDETAEEIAAMQTHSSSAVAIKAAEALSGLLDREYPTVEEYLRSLRQNSDALRRANRSHASLHTSQRAILTQVTDADPETVQAAKSATSQAIDEAIERIERGKREAGREAATLIDDGDTILTHDYSTTVLSALSTATEAGASVTVYVTEARPRVLGRKMARELAGMDGVSTHLVIDSAGGHYLQECDLVMVGMSCIVDNLLYNRVGTYPLAATAADSDVEMTAVGSGAKIIDDGFTFQNDYRPVSEVMREPPEGFSVETPAYDATPVRLLDAVVTDSGVFDPGSI